MLRYTLRRLVGLLIVLLIVLTLVFLLLHAAPGGPEYAYLGTNPTPAKRAEVLRQLGLNRPLWVQYLHFVGDMMTGHLGTSLTSNRPVAQLLMQRLPVTLELALVSFAVWVAIGLALGVVATARRGKMTDGFIRVGSVVGLSVPSFWLGLVLVVTFGLWWPGVLPSSGWVPLTADLGGNLQSLILPAFTLGLGSAAVISRTLRASLLDQLASDHISFGRAMGLPERTLLNHIALRNAVIPTVTVIGMMLGVFVSGTVLIENVFNLPGIGQLIVTSFTGHDYPVAIACTLITATTFLVANVLIDLLYFAINPRIRAQFGVSGALG